MFGVGGNGGTCMRLTQTTAGEAVAPRRRLSPHVWRVLGENALAYLYLLPTLLIIGAFSFYPVVRALLISLTHWMPLHSEYIGLQNYKDLLVDPEFWQSMGHTLYYVVGTVPTGILIALGIALLLNLPLKGRSFYRLAYFLPYVTTLVAVAMVWAWIFNQRYGLLNYFLRFLHLSPVGWLLEPQWAIPALIIMSIWKSLGWNVVVFLAGLQNVDRELQDAARVDGAGSWHVFRHITWPLLSPVTFFVSIISIIGAFKVFTEVYVLWGTTPGPLRSASTIVFFVYEKAFQQNNMGYASAASYVLFFIIFIITLIQFAFSRRRVYYS